MTIRNTNKFLQSFHKDVIRTEKEKPESPSLAITPVILEEPKEKEKAQEVFEKTEQEKPEITQELKASFTEERKDLSDEAIANFTTVIKAFAEQKEKKPTKAKKKKIIE
jgi:hypothetical protein